MNEKYKLYDEIVAATYANIQLMSKNNKIMLKGFRFNDPISRVFLEVASMVAYMTNKEIYVDGSWIDFVRARLLKKNKHIHHDNGKCAEGIYMYEVAMYEVSSFQVHDTIFEDIFKAYYEGKPVNV